MNGLLSVLNTGIGDIQVTFNQHDQGERDRAIRMLTDMQARGYAILVQLEDGSHVRATQIDAERGRYIIQLPAEQVEQAGPDATVEPTLKKGRTGKRGPQRRSGTVRVSVPVESVRATGIARSAGG